MSSLPWIKFFTSMVSEPKWRDVPADEFGVFSKMLLMGGVSTKRGVLVGTELQVVAALGNGWDIHLVRKTIARLSEKPFKTVKQTRSGLVIVNFHKHHPPSNYDPDIQSIRGSLGGRPRKPRVSEQESHGLNPTGEQSRAEQSESRLVSALREIRGWPSDDELDRLLVRKAVRDFSDLDLVAVAGELADWVLDNPIKANSSPRSRFRRFCENRRKWGGYANRVPDRIPSIDEQIAAQDAR